MSSARSSRWRRTLRSVSVRLTAWYVLVFAVGTLLLSAAVELEVRSSVRQAGAQRASGELAEHRSALEAGGTDALRHLAEAPRIAEESLFVRVVDARGVTTFEYRSTSVWAEGLEAARLVPPAGRPGLQSIRGRDGASWDLATAALNDGRFLQVAVRDEGAERVLSRLRTGLVVMWLLAMALGLVGGFLLTRLSLRPVQRLTATARQLIASGDLVLRVPESGVDDELRELSQLFNGVLARNQVLVQGMREALDNVAHDLRTPLTRLRAGAEIALRDTADPAGAREALADALEETDEVLGMLTSLMDITEAETGVMHLSMTELDLSALAADCIELYAHVAEERGVRVVPRLLPELQVKGDRHRLQQAIANLLDNALKYTPIGGLVQVLTSRQDDWAVLVVQDNGPGIPQADLGRIWTRLFRGDASRSQRGLGLGLSFVKAIIGAHHGQVTVESLGQGATFTIRLPRA